ncbi:hypothetical protein ACA910_007316 [Epithemia clementina (nom. ined.)]
MMLTHYREGYELACAFATTNVKNKKTKSTTTSNTSKKTTSIKKVVTASSKKETVCNNRSANARITASKVSPSSNSAPTTCRLPKSVVVKSSPALDDTSVSSFDSALSSLAPKIVECRLVSSSPQPPHSPAEKKTTKTSTPGSAQYPTRTNKYMSSPILPASSTTKRKKAADEDTRRQQLENQIDCLLIQDIQSKMSLLRTQQKVLVAALQIHLDQAKSSPDKHNGNVGGCKRTGILSFTLVKRAQVKLEAIMQAMVHLAAKEMHLKQVKALAPLCVLEELVQMDIAESVAKIDQIVLPEEKQDQEAHLEYQLRLNEFNSVMPYFALS